MRYFFIIITVFFPIFLFGAGHATSYENPFSVVYGGSSSNIYGDYKSIASSVQCVDNGGGGCNNNYTGYLFDATTRYVNSVSTAVIPLNSSTETLQLPSQIDGSNIVYAGLYWQGNITGADAANYATGIVGRDSVTIEDFNGTVHTLTADKVWYHDFWGDGTGSDGGYRSFYQGYKDVTDIVKASYSSARAVNNFTVGNIKSTIGTDYATYFWGDDTHAYDGVRIGFWGNWNLVVVYKYSSIIGISPQPTAKNVTIFQGFDALIPLGSGTTKSVNLSLSGFLTPLSIPAGESLSAKLLFYGAGGEKKLQYDTFQMQQGKTATYTDLYNATNPVDDAFNGSVSSFGVPIDSSITYYPGLDSDEFDVSSQMDVGQSSTSLSLSAYNVGGTGDQIFPGMIAFSTDIFEPQFCYDYAYRQNGVYFTEDNNGTTDPYLSTAKLPAGVVTGEPIEVTIYLRSLVDTQVTVSDMNVSILDMNTSQATYIRNTTSLTPTGSLTAQPIADSSLGSVDDANIIGVPIGTLPSNQSFYLYYQVDPLQTSLNMPLNVNVSYNVAVDPTNPIAYSHNIGASHKIQMCSSSNFTYTPVKGKFNVVNDIFYPYSNGNYYNNLPTEIASRADNYKIVAYDPSSLDTPKDVNTTVAVELIDASAFHDTTTSCDEPTSAISDRIWITFKSSSTASFTGQDIIDNILLADPQAASKFYQTARENVAFRVSYPPSDDNGSLIVEETAPGKFHLVNFPGYAGSTCVSPVTATIYTGAATHTKTYTQVPEACANAGTSSASSMTQNELNVCMECIYGHYVPYTCSRDNFAIRPEALMIKINDQNQTSGTTKTRIADSVSGVTTPVNSVVDISSGYNYDLEITATNHLDNTAAPGYTKSFGYTSDDNVSYIWEPRGGVVTTGCNDIGNKSISLRFLNGYVDLNSSVDQVGDYRLHAIDTSWTKVDHDPTLMTHHTGSYFLSSNVPDCTLNTSATQTVGSTTLNGCNISSSHTNSDASLQYNDYDITFHPYKFDLSSIVASVGLTNDTTFNANTFIYMSDMSVPADENMSVHMNGNIRPIGRDGALLSNFVNNCFAKPIDISISKTNYTTTAAGYGYRYHDYNSTGDLNSTLFADINNTSGPIALNTTHFLKDMLGSINSILNLNFDRNISKPIDPQTITFNDYIVNCQSPGTDCSFLADLTTKTTQGDLNVSKTVKHYYGRTHAPRYRFPTNVGDAFIYYEVYCGSSGNKALLPNGTATTESIDELDWYNNTNHLPVRDGSVGSVTERKSSPNVTLNSLAGTNPEDANIIYNQSAGYPYKTTMQNSAAGWLIYNKYDNTATTNEFEVEFYRPGGNWTGVKNTNTTTDSNASDTTSKRIFW
ncbi:hypothetical protein [Sulfurimonas sp. HSL-1716]|uniref:hypothetical protein n=1 Tax=Hydrocurvibacter sulfurireducens TaxID=3131937 RepID=UPI0031F8F2EB